MKQTIQLSQSEANELVKEYLGCGDPSIEVIITDEKPKEVEINNINDFKRELEKLCKKASKLGIGGMGGFGFCY